MTSRQQDIADALEHLGLPWLFRQMGVGTWVRRRLLHIPDAALLAASRVAGVTPEQYRAVEWTQSLIVEGRLGEILDNAL